MVVESRTNSYSPFCFDASAAAAAAAADEEEKGLQLFVLVPLPALTICQPSNERMSSVHAMAHTMMVVLMGVRFKSRALPKPIRSLSISKTVYTRYKQKIINK